MSTAGNHDMLMGSTLPVATDASRMSLGFKDDGKLYKTTSAGVETEIGGAGAGVSSLAKSGSTGQTGAVTLSRGLRASLLPRPRGTWRLPRQAPQVLLAQSGATARVHPLTRRASTATST